MKHGDFWLGVSTFAMGIAYAWLTFQLPAGDHALNSPRSFPLLLAVLLSLVSLVLTIKALLPKVATAKKVAAASARSGSGRSRRGGFYVLWTGIYIFLGIPYLGFVVATVSYLIVGIMFYKEVKWHQVIPVSLGATFLFYYVFSHLMHIKMP